MTEQCRTRVVMADQHLLLAECLGVVFVRRGYDFRVLPLAGEPAGVEAVLRRVRALRPDVLLVNADLGPGCSGISLIAPMTAEGVAVVVITETVDEATWGECLAYGARAVLPKSASVASVVTAVRGASADESVLDRAERTRLLRVFLRRSSHLCDLRRQVQRLTVHEADVLRHLVSGRTVAQLAGLRDLSEATVRGQVTSVLAKLEAVSRLTAIGTGKDVGGRP